MSEKNLFISAISICIGSLIAMAVTWDLHVKHTNRTLKSSTLSNHQDGLIWSGVVFIVLLGLFLQSWSALFGVVLLLAGIMCYGHNAYMIVAIFWTIVFLISGFLTGVNIYELYSIYKIK